MATPPPGWGQRFVERLLILDQINNLLEDGPPPDPASAAAYHFLSQTLEDIPTMKQMLKDLVAHPQLLLGDVQAYRTHVQTHGHCFDDPELCEQPKSSARAAEIRRIGNELYGRREYPDALEKYNESICLAPNDSEDLAIGYANRSAVFFEQGEYPLALANIALAKKHNYPEKLMPKLLTRESSCRQRIDENDREGNPVRFPTLAFNLAANSRIPFLAKGITTRKPPANNDKILLLAKKDFKVGDVILRERPMKGSVCPVNEYLGCNFCLAENMHHLIPCPDCTTAMYCNETCLTEGRKIHRFECGIASELGYLNGYWVGPRMFFYGLTLFDNDVKQFMKFCKAHMESGKDFFDVDYSNYDPREEFKAFLGRKSPVATLRPVYDSILRMNAAIVYAMYMKVPLVRSLIASKVQRNFMLKCFFHFMALADHMSIYRDIEGQLYPIASAFGQSDDPNTFGVTFAGQLKLIVLRPVRRGERFIVSYELSSDLRQMDVSNVQCVCLECFRREVQMGLAGIPPGSRTNRIIAPAHMETLKRVMGDMELNNADKLNALQQFIQRYGHLHPHCELTGILWIYRVLLAVSHENEIKSAVAVRKGIA